MIRGCHIIWYLGMCFPLYAEVDYQKLKLLNNEIDMESKAASPLSLEKTGAYVVRLKRLLEEPYMRIMTLLADKYELLSIDDTAILARATKRHDEEALERARLWCLRLISRYAAAYTDAAYSCEVYKILAAKIAQDAAGTIGGRSLHIHADKQNEHMSIPLIPCILIGSVLGGIYTYRKLHAYVDERSLAIDKEMTALGQRREHDLVVAQEKYGMIERRLHGIQDDVRVTNENLIDQARSMAQVMINGFTANDEARIALDEKINTLSRTINIQREVQAQGLEQLANNIESNMILEQNRGTELAQQLEHLKQRIEQQATVVHNVNNLVQKQDEQLRDHLDETYELIGLVNKEHESLEQHMYAVDDDVQRLHAKPREEGDTFKKVTNGVCDAGDALHRLGRGVSSIRRAVLPAEDITHSLVEGLAY